MEDTEIGHINSPNGDRFIHYWRQEYSHNYIFKYYVESDLDIYIMLGYK